MKLIYYHHDGGPGHYHDQEGLVIPEAEGKRMLANGEAVYGEVWSDWAGILAETLRLLLEDNPHPNRFTDARYNLERYDEQIKKADEAGLIYRGQLYKKILT